MTTEKANTVKQTRLLMGNISQAFIYKIINSGELRSFKMGGRRLVSTAAIDDYIKKQEQATADQIAGVS